MADDSDCTKDWEVPAWNHLVNWYAAGDMGEGLDDDMREEDSSTRLVEAGSSYAVFGRCMMGVPSDVVDGPSVSAYVITMLPSSRKLTT